MVFSWLRKRTSACWTSSLHTHTHTRLMLLFKYSVLYSNKKIHGMILPLAWLCTVLIKLGVARYHLEPC